LPRNVLFNNHNGLNLRADRPSTCGGTETELSPNDQRILVVDDEASVRKVVARALHDAGYKVEAVGTRAGAIESLATRRFDLALLDVQLPDGDGIELAGRIVERQHIPVIMLTMAADEQVAVRALRLGADDYVRKPFSAQELIARIASVLRRAQPAEDTGAGLVRAGDLVLDPDGHRARVGTTSLPLTPTEFRVLMYLAQHPDRVLGHDDLLGEVWGSEYRGEYHTLHVTISRLRQKLGGSAALIRTIPGVGYELTTGG
jgi:two-component system KDP operon response regulator KdpE